MTSHFLSATAAFVSFLLLSVPAVAAKEHATPKGAKSVDGFTHRTEDVNGVKIHFLVGGKGKIVADAGHWLPEDNPKEFVRVVSEFLAE